MARDVKDQRNFLEEDIEIPEETLDLNPLLLQVDEEVQEELVAVVMEDYRNAMDARKQESWGTDKQGKAIDFDTKYANLLELYEGNDEIRPEEWMCGRSLKISQAIIEMIVARLFPAIWNEDLIRWRPVNFADKKRVEDVNDIMFWVTSVWMKMGRDVLTVIRESAMMGTSYIETHWSVKKKDLDKTEEVQVMGEDGQPMQGEDGQPMTVESKLFETKEQPKIRTIPITRLLTQPGCTDIQEEPIIKMEDFYYHELEMMERQGLAQNVKGQLLEEVDKTLEDKFGMELEKAEKIQDINAKRRLINVPTLIWYGNYDIDGDGFAEDICVMIAQKQEVFIRAFKLIKVSRRGKRLITKCNFVDRIHKLLGIGVLEQVRPLAEEIDACFRQLQDANTLSILRWGFYDPNSDYDPGEHVAKPRAMYPVTNPTQNVYFPDMSVPIERLINAIRLVMEFVERLTAASSYLMGKESNIVGGSGTATRTAAIVNSAETRFNLPTINIREALSEVITDVFDLCFMNAPEGLEKRIIGEDGEPIFHASEDIKNAFMLEMDAYLAPSASFGDVNMERELSILLYDKFVMGGNPLVVGDPARLWRATENILKAYKQDVEDWIGRAPSKKNTNDPVEEQTYFRQGEYVHAEPQENHLEHIAVHKKLLTGQDPDVLLWPKEGLEFLRAHIEEHMQMMQLVMQFQQGQKKGGDLGQQGPNTGGNPGNAGGSPAAPGKQGVSEDARQGSGQSQKQAAGTTAGTPEVR